MPTESPVLPSPRLSAERAERVAVLLRALYRTAQGVRLYGAGHAATRHAAAETSSALAALAPGEHPLRLTIAPDRLLLDDDDLPDEPAVRDLARLLYAARVAVLVIGDAPGPEGIVALAHLLAVRPAGAAGEGAVARWGDADDRALAAACPGLRVMPISYASLSARDADEHGLARDGFDWRGLVYALAHPGPGGGGVGGGAGAGAGGGGVAAADTAAAIVAGLEERLSSAPPGMAAASLADALRPVAAGCGSEGRSALLVRLSGAVSRLTPEARRRLISIDDSSPARSLAALADLSAALPASDVIAALEGIGSHGTLPCVESLRLLARLAEATRGDAHGAADVRRAAERIVADLGSRGADAERSEMLESFRRLLLRNDQAEYNPQDYERLISMLAAGTAPPPAIRVPASLGAAWEDEGGHTALLLGSLLEEEETHAGDAAGLLRRLGGHFGTLVGAGRIDVLAGAAQRADSMLAAPQAPAATSAIKEFLLSFRTPERLGAVLSAAPPGSPAAEHAMTIIRLGGADALAGTIRSCASRNDRREDLTALLSDPALEGATTLQRVARTEPDCAVWLLRAGVVPLGLLPNITVPLLQHADPEVVGDAFLGLHASTAAWTREQVNLALAHPSDRVQRLGLAHTGDLPAQDRPEILSAFIRSARPDRSPGVVEAASDRLVQCGDAGERSALRLFGSLARRPSPRRVHLALDLLDALRRARHRRAAGGPAGAARLALMLVRAILGLVT